METSLRMRTLLRSTLDLEFCPWPTLDLTPTVLNFSSVPPRPSGLMESTSSLDRLWREWTSQRRSWSPTAVSCNFFIPGNQIRDKIFSFYMSHFSSPFYVNTLTGGHFRLNCNIRLAFYSQ